MLVTSQRNIVFYLTRRVIMTLLGRLGDMSESRAGWSSGCFVRAIFRNCSELRRVLLVCLFGREE